VFAVTLGAVGLACVVATALAYRRWGTRGLLCVPVGLVVLLALWLGMVLLLSGPSGGI
jgi:hypothetical protein